VERDPSRVGLSAEKGDPLGQMKISIERQGAGGAARRHGL